MKEDDIQKVMNEFNREMNDKYNVRCLIIAARDNEEGKGEMYAGNSMDGSLLKCVIKEIIRHSEEMGGPIINAVGEDIMEGIVPDWVISSETHMKDVANKIAVEVLMKNQREFKTKLKS